MDERRVTHREVAALSPVQLLELAVERLLAESPADLPEQVALDRARSLLVCSERLQAARLAAVRDVDRRELFALDATGSTRAWLRVQPGGDGGQLSLARRLEQRPLVEQACANGCLSVRAAEQVCAVLASVPARLEEPLVQAVLLDGVGGLLQSHTGGLVLDDPVTPDLVAARADALAVLQAAARDTASAPAQRLEGPLVLLATRLAQGHLGPALRQLRDALLPDGADGVDRDPYFFELRELLDGDVDVRGHLTPEVGHALAEEVARRVAQAKADAKKAAAGTATADHSQHRGTDANGGADPALRLAAWDQALQGELPSPAAGVSLPRAQDPARAVGAGRQRHDALAQLLHDLGDVPPGSGRPAAPRLTIVAPLAALEGRPGALPAQLATHGPPATLTTAQLQRLGCGSDLAAVLLDAYGNVVGASHTRRNLTHRERRALRAQWGPTCAIAGCPSTRTVPHHVEPYWLTRHTRLRDVVPACEHCHHDLHDGHRTLRLRDGRLIDEHGWVRATAAA